VCVVAVAERSRAAAQCVLSRDPYRPNWWLGGPRSGRAVIFGVVAGDVTAARVTMRGKTAEVEARGNVFGGVLPFRYSDRDRPRVELLRMGGR
jgi:hypothetical protein